MTIDGVRERVARGETYEAIVAEVLERGQTDGSGGRVRLTATYAADALTAARAADAAGQGPGRPLAGLPVTIKDLFDGAGKIPCPARPCARGCRPPCPTRSSSPGCDGLARRSPGAPTWSSTPWVGWASTRTTAHRATRPIPMWRASRVARRRGPRSRSGWDWRSQPWARTRPVRGGCPQPCVGWSVSSPPSAGCR